MELAVFQGKVKKKGLELGSLTRRIVQDKREIELIGREAKFKIFSKIKRALVVYHFPLSPPYFCSTLSVYLHNILSSARLIFCFVRFCC